MITRTARARYEGMGQQGKGWITTQSGVLSEQPYGFRRASRMSRVPTLRS